MKNSTSQPSPWHVFGLTAIAVFLFSIDSTILFAAFKAIRESFPGTSSEDLSWVLNAYTIVYASILVPAGRLGDLHGQKKIFLIGLAVFVLASALCGLSPSPAFLIASRVLQAVGAALLTPSSLSLVLLAFPAAKRPIAVALWGAVGGLAAAIGPSFGSFIVDHFGWQSAFYVNVPIGLIALYRGVRALQESKALTNAAFPDIFGSVLLAISIGLVALGAVKLNVWGIGSASTIGAFSTGIIGLILFVHRSARIAAPTVDLTLFRNSTYRTANLATFIFGIVFTMMFFGFFFFVTSIWGYSLTRAGLSITPGPLMVVPTAIISGRIAAQTGHRLLLVGGGLLFALGGLWFLLVPGQESNYLTTWLPGTIITGIGVGLLIPSLTGAAVFGLPPERFGVGIAINSAIRQLASVFGVVFTILLVGSPQPQIHQFHMLYICLILGGILISLISVRVNTVDLHRGVILPSQ